MTRIPRTLPVVLIAAIALVLAFSGGAMAAKLITGKQIKDNTVTTKDIKDGSLQSLDLSSAAIAELQSGATGPAGPAGPMGDAGPAGAPGTNGTNGTNGVSGLQYVSGSVAVPAGTQNFVSVACPAGKKVIGTAADWVTAYLPTSSTFNGTMTGALAYGKNTSAIADTLRMTIACITAS